MMKKHLLILVCAALAAVLVGVTIYQGTELAKARRELDEMHAGAVHQAAEELDALIIDMDKLLLSRDPALTAGALSRIAMAAQDVHRCLLPAPELTGAAQFAGRLAEDAAALLPLLAQGGRLDVAQLRQLEENRALCARLAAALALGIPPDLPLPPAAEPAPMRGLPQGDITQEEALAIARSFVGDERVLGVQAAPGTTGAVPAYGVTVRTADLQLNLEVTLQGGKVLWMMPETASFTAVQSPSACVAAAQAFLDARGFGETTAVDQQLYDGLCVITLAPVQDGVILYTDLVHVQVRMDLAQVVGLEAHAYWQNHTPRQLPAPAFTAEEALRALGRQADAALCLIPFGGGERLCHELSVVEDGEIFLLYIDAADGTHLALRKRVRVEGGVLTV